MYLHQRPSKNSSPGIVDDQRFNSGFQGLHQWILNPRYCFPKVPYRFAGDAVVEVGGSYGLRKSPIVVASEMQMPEAHAAASFSALAGNISTAAASMLPGIASMQKLFTTDGRELRATLAAHTTFKASRGTTGVSGLLPETETSELAGPPQLKRLHPCI